MLVGEESYDSRAPFDLAIVGFTGVGSSSFCAMSRGETEDSEAFWEVDFSPLGELGLGLRIALDEAR